MSKQPAFFMDSWELFQKENPERFTRKRGGSGRKRSPRAVKVHDCNTCGLCDKCRHPKLERFGEGRKKILIVGQCPGRIEDREGRNFIGPAGRLLRKNCDYLNIDLDIDCERTNVVRCYPGKDARGKDKDPTKDQIKCCLSNLEKDIQEVQPRLIICFGTPAIQAVLKSSVFSSPPIASVVHGKVFPYHKYNCWVGCAYHPSFFLHRKNKEDVPDDEIIFSYDMVNILSYLDESLPKPLTAEGNRCITDVNEAITAIEKYCDHDKPTSFDYETNMLDSFQKDGKIVSIAITDKVESAEFIPLGFEGIFTVGEQEKISVAWKAFLKSSTPKICQNYYMEELWGRNKFGQSMNNFIHDTMVTAHVINCNARTTGLAYQAFELTGHEYKKMVDVVKIGSEPIEKVCDYNCWDARYPIMSYQRQISLLDGNLKKFNDFFTRSLITLANYKYRGIQIDEKVLTKIEDDFRKEAEEYKTAVTSSKAVIEYNKLEVNKEKPFSIDSSVQIGKVLYGICGVSLTKKRQTKTGKGCTGKEVFAEILSTTKDDQVRRILSNVTAYRSNLKVLERATEYRRLVDSSWRVHPSFGLNIARSYRSQCEGPNIQNVFKHNLRQKVFRRCIVPRPGHIFLEPDYDGAEICMAAMVSGDPVLTEQIQDGINIHWMWASRIFSREGEKYTELKEQKAVRNKSKNGFFFPSIYGAVPASIACSLSLNTDFVISVQNRFWDEYSYIKEWQLKTIHDYEKTGYVELVTGGRRPGPLNINKLYNTPIQGPAYHLLQAAANRIDEELIRREYKTLSVAEIHDAIILDTHLDEMEEVIEMSEGIMCSKMFDWQGDVPMSVSWEYGDKNWYEMADL